MVGEAEEVGKEVRWLGEGGVKLPQREAALSLPRALVEIRGHKHSTRRHTAVGSIDLSPSLLAV